MNIGVFKLVTGEEVIAKFDPALETYSLSNPRVLTPVQTGQGQFAIALVPWFVGIPDAKNITIRKADVIAHIPSVPKALEDNYLQQTSGLDLTSRM